ncbi:hypothetical protein D1AOALGA4SA_4442 [Olavius algarvensis Delta 1 endosymbiont]|nr:hypothetical protein D1AOALGA4SA_4442 [Olavius algarvensis Delta 1 endosymbiont]
MFFIFITPLSLLPIHQTIFSSYCRTKTYTKSYELKANCKTAITIE